MQYKWDRKARIVYPRVKQSIKFKSGTGAYK